MKRRANQMGRPVKGRERQMKRMLKVNQFCFKLFFRDLIGSVTFDQGFIRPLKIDRKHSEILIPRTNSTFTF